MNWNFFMKAKAKTTAKPQTPEQWAAYRATLSCKLGIDCLNGTTPPPEGLTRTDYALYNLLHALQDLATLHLPQESR
jgi:hypothetical protein